MQEQDPTRSASSHEVSSALHASELGENKSQKDLQMTIGGVTISYDASAIKSIFEESSEDEELADAFAMHATLVSGGALYDADRIDIAPTEQSFSLEEIVSMSHRDNTFKSRLAVRNVLKQLGIDVANTHEIYLTKAQKQLVIARLNPFGKSLR